MQNNNIHVLILVKLLSICGHSITPYYAHKMYNATKTAITVLCEGLRHELSLVDSKIKVSVSIVWIISILTITNGNAIYSSLYNIIIIILGYRFWKIVLQSISPGSVDTDLFKNAQFKPSSQVVSTRPALKPEDVAAAIITTLGTPPHVQVSLIILYYKYI